METDIYPSHNNIGQALFRTYIDGRSALETRGRPATRRRTVRMAGGFLLTNSKSEAMTLPRAILGGCEYHDREALVGLASA